MMTQLRRPWALSAFALILIAGTPRAFAENETQRARKVNDAASAELENSLSLTPEPGQRPSVGQPKPPLTPDDPMATQRLLDESQRAIEAADREAAQAAAAGTLFPVEKSDQYAGFFARWTQAERDCSAHFAISVKAEDGPAESLDRYRKTIAAARQRKSDDPNARFCVDVEHDFTRFAHRLHQASQALPSGNYEGYRVTAGPCHYTVGEMSQVAHQTLTLAKVGAAPLMSEAEFARLQQELGYLSEGERVTVYQTIFHLAHDRPARLDAIPGLAHRLIDRLRAEN